MAKIAHLTDLHLLEDDHAGRRGATERLRLAYLSIARPIDARDRRLRASRALAQARRSGADHLVITGDLTEDGLDSQFSVLAQVLEESGLPASRITLVPGNHDAYSDGEAWTRALAGPLRPYAETSAPGAVTDLGGALIVAVSTAFHQPFTRSAGAIDASGLASIERAAQQARRCGAAVLVAQHHPPRGYAVPPIQWIDGLRGHAALAALLQAHDHAHVLHGHTHAVLDSPVRPGASPRVFSAESVVDGASPLRLYHAQHGRLRPASEALPFHEPRAAVA